MNPVRMRRYALILGLLALAGLLMISWWAFNKFNPNFFDREQVDSAEMKQLESVDLKQAVSQAYDWPQFRGPNRDGVSSGAIFRTNWNEASPKILWRSPCGAGYSSLAIADGRLFTMDRQGNQERILCLDAVTGNELGNHSYSADYSGLSAGYAGGPRATPTIHDGIIFTVGATGIITALEIPKVAGGPMNKLWQRELLAEYDAKLPTWGIACSPLVVGETIIVQPGGKKGSVVALDRRTGEPRWTCDNEPSGYSSPILATLGGIKQIVAITGKSIVGIHPETGAKLWKHPWETQHFGNIAMPVIVGDYVFASSDYGKGCVLLRVSGDAAKVVYFRPNKLMRNHHSSCVHRDGYLYGFDNSELKCIDLRTGEAIEDWPSPEARVGKGSVTRVGDSILCLSERGTLTLLNADPKQGRVLGQMENVLNAGECWAAPAVLGGRIYLRDAEKIVCLDAAKK